MVLLANYSQHRPGSRPSPLLVCPQPWRDLKRRCLLTEHLHQRPARRHRAPQHRICGPRPNRPTSDQRPKQAQARAGQATLASYSHRLRNGRNRQTQILTGWKPFIAFMMKRGGDRIRHSQGQTFQRWPLAWLTQPSWPQYAVWPQIFTSDIYGVCSSALTGRKARKTIIQFTKEIDSSAIEQSCSETSKYYFELHVKYISQPHQPQKG